VHDDVRARRRIPLMIACGNGQLEVAKFFVAQHPFMIAERTKEDLDARTIAKWRGDAEMERMLLDKTSNSENKDKVCNNNEVNESDIPIENEVYNCWLRGKCTLSVTQDVFHYQAYVKCEIASQIFVYVVLKS